MLAARRILALRHFTVLLCGAALLLKLLVPAGYMIDRADGRIAVTICSGTQPRTLMIELPGTKGDRPDHGRKDHGRAEMPCAFSGLSAAALGATDPIQLAALIAFVMAVGLAVAAVPALSAPPRLRPPPRGPPAAV